MMQYYIIYVFMHVRRNELCLVGWSVAGVATADYDFAQEAIILFNNTIHTDI